ncbi:MAG: extensin family protein [Kofleriaceae bacterium]
MRRTLLLVVVAVVATALGATGARAEDGVAPSCHAALRDRGITFEPATRKGIDLGVEVRGPIAGVEFAFDGPLVLDCSLVVSLAEMAPYLTALGLTKATISSGYSRRNVRGTKRPSRHSFGLAADISGFAGDAVGSLRVSRDYEQGLGDERDCVGQPITEGGALLKILQCQLIRSGLFRVVLSPDYDDAHHDHFHVEALAWPKRAAVRATTTAIH